MNHPKPGTPEYQEHVAEEIEYFSSLFKKGEGHETLHIQIPPSWQEAERRAAMVIHAKTGDFMNGHVEKRLNKHPGARLLSLGSVPGAMEISFAQNAPQAEIVCMDLNSEVLDLGRERAGQLGLNMEFIPTDLNTVEFAVRDGVPVAIDFCNPAPDCEAAWIGQANFEWVVEAISEMAIRKAREHVPGRDNLSWGKLLQAAVTQHSLGELV